MAFRLMRIDLITLLKLKFGCSELLMFIFFNPFAQGQVEFDSFTMREEFWTVLFQKFPVNFNAFVRSPETEIGVG